MKRYLAAAGTIAIIVLLTSFIYKYDGLLGFPRLQMAEVSSIPDDTSKFLSPERMVVADGHLVIYDSKSELPFTVFKLPSHEDTAEVIQRVSNRQTLSTPNMRNMVPVKDGFQLIDKSYSMRKITFNEEAMFVVETKPIPLQTDLMNGILPFGGGYICLSPLFDGYDYIDPNTGKRSAICRNPVWEDEIETSNNLLLRVSWAAVHPDGNRFATFYAFHNRVIYYDSRGTVLKEVSLPLEGENDPRWNAPLFYSYIVASDDKRIVVNYGNKEYHFYDWKGNLLKRVGFDKSLYPVTYDFSGKTFYGIDNTGDSFRLCSVRPGGTIGNSVSYNTVFNRILKR